MGLYTQYATGSDSVIVADESYVGVEGCMRAIEEAYENEHAIFNALIGVDFAEAYHKVNESMVSESQLEALTESTVGDIWKKVVEFVKRAWAKIKGIIDTLITKVKLMFTRDGKTLVTKYGKTVRSNVNKGACDKMKFKWSEKVELGTAAASKTSIESLELFTKTKSELSGTEAVDKTDAAGGDTDAQAIADTKKTFAVRPFTTEEKTDFEEKAFGKLLNQSAMSASEFKKEFLSDFEDGLDEKEGLTIAIVEKIEGILNGNAKLLTDLEKDKNTLNREFKDILKKAEAIQTKHDKATGKTGYSTINASASGRAARVISLVTIITKVTNTYYAEVSNGAKKTFGIARSVFVKAATYKAKKKDIDESALLTEALLEASDYEVEAMWENDLDGSIFY